MCDRPDFLVMARTTVSFNNQRDSNGVDEIYSPLLVKELVKTMKFCEWCRARNKIPFRNDVKHVHRDVF